MATIYRAYHRAEDFQKYRIFTVYTTGAGSADPVAVALLGAHAAVDLHHLSDLESVALQRPELRPVHDVRAPRRREPQQSERRALYGAFIASYLVLFLGFHTGPSSDPLFISLGIPLIVSRWEQIVLGAGFPRALGLRLFAPGAGSRMAKADAVPDAVFVAVSVVSAAGGDVAGLTRTGDSTEPLQHGRAGGDALGAISLDHQLLRAPRGDGGAWRRWRPLAYFGVLVAGGIALFVPGPWLASRVFHHDFTASFLIFGAGQHSPFHSGRRHLASAIAFCSTFFRAANPYA